MRKRILFLSLTLLLTIFIQPVLAVTEQQAIRVTYAVNQDNQFGFSSSSVNSAAPVVKPEYIYFKANSSGDFVTDEFFIFWQLYDSEQVTISLSMSPLTKTTDSTKKIDYKISDLYSINATSQDTSASTVYTDGTITGCRLGSTPLSLIFMDESTNSTDLTGQYEGTLTLTLTTTQ